MDWLNWRMQSFTLKQTPLFLHTLSWYRCNTPEGWWFGRRDEDILNSLEIFDMWQSVVSLTGLPASGKMDKVQHRQNKRSAAWILLQVLGSRKQTFGYSSRLANPVVLKVWSRTCNISISRVPVRYVSSWTLPQIYWMRNSGAGTQWDVL